MKQHGAHQENTTGIKLSVLKSHFTIFLIQNFVQNTKNTCEYHLYCWNHVCKVNEWCLVDCFHCKLRVSTQTMVCNYCTAKFKKFSACGRLLMASWAIFCKSKYLC